MSGAETAPERESGSSRPGTSTGPGEAGPAAGAAAGAVEVRRSVPGDDGARDRFVRGAPRGTFFHLSGWARIVEREMGHRREDLVALDGGDVVGVLPLMSCRGLRGRASLISMPYAVYGGPVARDGAVVRELYAAAEARALELGVGRLELRCQDDPGLGVDLPRSELYATFVRELPDTVDGVLARMPKKSRAEARKARDKHGLELVEGREHLDVLVDLFHRNKRSLGSPALPRRWFQAFLDEFGEDVRVHLVHRDGQSLAATMSFLYGDTLLAYYSGTADGADREYSASNFLYLALQEWCVEQGVRVFDFGRSRKDSGAHAFKRRQGFEPADLFYAFRLVKDRELPSLNPSNPKTERLRETWSRLPLWATRPLSGVLARFLP